MVVQLADMAFLQMKHGKGRKLRFVKEFDYIGAFLATMGLLLFLMGLSWGGSLYPVCHDFIYLLFYPGLNSRDLWACSRAELRARLLIVRIQIHTNLV
jgi:hypothetical protein